MIKRGNHALSPDAFEVAANETDALMLDTRAPKLLPKALFLTPLTLVSMVALLRGSAL